MTPSTTRREFLRHSAETVAALTAAAATPFLPTLSGGMTLPAAARPKLPVAAVVTVYFPKSHTDVLVGKILEGWRHDGGAGPDLKLLSLYVDQVGKSDLSRTMARRHGFKLARTIDEAITLGTR